MTPPNVTKLAIDTAWMKDVLLELLRIPSPSGRTDVVMQHIGDRLKGMGLSFELTRRGALIVTLDATDSGDIAAADSGTGEEADTLERAVVVHSDTIGCIVRELKDNGRLAIAPVGTHSSRFSEGTRVAIFTDDPDRTYSGTILPMKASGHAFGDAVDELPHGWDCVEVRVDEKVANADDLAALGIQVGDFVAQLAFPMITRSGFVVSRHLDDKAGVAAALAAFKAVKDADVTIPVRAHLMITISEEVGHGASSGLSRTVSEMLSVDAAVVAPGQYSSETGVSIAMQDLHGPFDFHLTRRLHALAVAHDLEVHRDVFRYYRSDVAAALEAGAETRAALIGFGVDATHGHERTHLDAMTAVAELVALYLQTPLTFGSWDAHPTGPLERFPSSSVQPVRLEPLLDPEADSLVENVPFGALDEFGGPHPAPPEQR